MSKAVIIFSIFSIPFLNAQIESIDIDSEEYVDDESSSKSIQDNKDQKSDVSDAHEIKGKIVIDIGGTLGNSCETDE